MIARLRGRRYAEQAEKSKRNTKSTYVCIYSLIKNLYKKEDASVLYHGSPVETIVDIKIDG